MATWYVQARVAFVSGARARAASRGGGCRRVCVKGFDTPRTAKSNNKSVANRTFNSIKKLEAVGKSAKSFNFELILTLQISH